MEIKFTKTYVGDERDNGHNVVFTSGKTYDVTDGFARKCVKDEEVAEYIEKPKKRKPVK